MASIGPDNDIEQLLQIAEGKIQEESRPLSEFEKFILRFELKSCETNTLSFWALYRAYRLWCQYEKLECLPKGKFRTLFSKYFRMADGRWAALCQKSYFVTGNIDTSDNAYWAEKKFESDERAKKEREHKQRYPHNYPNHKYKKDKAQSD